LFLLSWPWSFCWELPSEGKGHQERDIKKRQEEGRDKISQEAGAMAAMDNWDSDEENAAM